MTLEKAMLAAQGYAELGMTDDALRELDSIPDEFRLGEGVLQMRLFVLMRARRWAEAMDVCTALRAANPDGTTGFIHGAFCLHELGRTNEARELLLAGPAALKNEPTYHYNLGCYAAVLGYTHEALHYLKASFVLDKKFRDIARIDPDLRSVRDLIS